ncbi:MAG: DUF58 domain-containing protein [Kiritimatiellae bacterium]|nr:DUF58 domain-containing protein [Kiritimatiellia bacterium]
MADKAHSSRSFLDPGVLSRLSRMSVAANNPMLGSITGIHRSATRGTSVEFAEYRKYVPGDDPKHIDWQVYARSDRFYIKEFEADTNLRAYMVLDASGSMAYDSGEGSRFEFARSIAAHLAYLLVQQGDAVGLHCCGEETQVDLPARQAPSHLHTYFDLMEGVEPAGESTLVESLHSLAERVQRRAVVMVLTDGFMPAPDLLDALQHLCFCRHEVSFFHLLDPKELKFDFTRPVRFVDLEGGADLVADPSVMQSTYLHGLHRHLETLKDGCRKFQIDYRRVMTNQSYEQAITSYLLGHAGMFGKKGGGRK